MGRAGAHRDRRIGRAGEWLTDAAKFIPDGYVLGQVIAAAPDGSEATIAVFPASANDPSSPGSVFDPGQVLDVLLQGDGHGVVPIAGAFHDREPVGAPLADPADHSEESYAYLHREIWSHGQAFCPSGTEACDLRGWSIDERPAA